MVSILKPVLNEVYFINQYTMFHILEGNGAIQVDFKNYIDWSDKLIFLEKGQYIKFLSDDFKVRQIRFEKELVFQSKNVRVLFKHLVSLGYINFLECEDCRHYLEDTVLAKPRDIIDVSSQHWYWQNPFNANPEEYHIIFDVKDIIDTAYKNHLSNQELANIIGTSGQRAHALVSDKIGLSIKGMLGRKRLTESQKDVAFTDKSIKEIAYEFGYKDPAYFNRVFKQNTGLSPLEFRSKMAFEPHDQFLEDLYALLHEFHSSKRSVEFYASQLHISEKTLSRKVREKLQISIGQLIRHQIIQSSKKLLKQGVSVTDTAYQLGFGEANHFSVFFKRYNGIQPSEFHTQKYKQ